MFMFVHVLASSRLKVERKLRNATSSVGVPCGANVTSETGEESCLLTCRSMPEASVPRRYYDVGTKSRRMIYEMISMI